VPVTWYCSPALHACPTTMRSEQLSSVSRLDKSVQRMVTYDVVLDHDVGDLLAPTCHHRQRPGQL